MYFLILKISKSNVIFFPKIFLGIYRLFSIQLNERSPNLTHYTHSLIFLKAQRELREFDLKKLS